MIPKVIHFCWLSNDPFPPSIQKCIDSWKKNMPDYEIKRWSTENFDINSVPLVKEAFEAKKYAFAADYIRCYALYTEGGIYLDSDVFVQKDFSPLLEGARYVTGMEYLPLAENLYKQQVDENGDRRVGIDGVSGIGLQAAIMASEVEHPLMKKCLDFYRNRSLSYIMEHRLLAPVVQAQAAEEYGYKYVKKKQLLKEGVVIYPTSVFGQGCNEMKGRYAIHMCAGTWVRKTLKNRLISFFARIGIYGRYVWLKDKLGLVKNDR